MERLLNSESDNVCFSAAKDILDRAGYKAQDKLKIDSTFQTSEKLADIFNQIGGEGLEE